MILHQAASVGGGTIVTVQFASEDSQHSHQLTSMMGRMSQSPSHYPGARTLHIEEFCALFPPGFILLPQRGEPFSAVFRVSLHELEPCLLLRKRRRAYVNSKHVAKPEILADALMHHLLMHAAPARIAVSRTNGKIFVLKLAPHADDLQPLGRIGLDKEVIFHRA